MSDFSETLAGFLKETGETGFTGDFLLAGERIRLFYESRELQDYFLWHMRLIESAAGETTAPFAGIYIKFREGLANLGKGIEDSLRNDIIQINGYDTKIRFYNGNVIKGVVFAWCPALRKGWVLIDPESWMDFKAISHNLTPLIALMSPDLGAVLIHAASVGKNGKGCLISGLSGSGKSTLAAAALVYGMDFVSDDTTLFRTKDSMAFPITSTIHLGPDSVGMLPEIIEAGMNMYAGRANKRHMDLTPYAKQFMNGMRAEFIVSPKIISDDGVAVVRTRKEEVIMPLIFSSVYQLGEERDSQFSRNLLHALRPLDTYTIFVNSDMKKNAAVLERFTEEYKK